MANHRALVTGASGGIGSEIALMLASMRCDLIIHANQEQSVAQSVADRATQEFEVNADTVVATLDTPDGAGTLIKHVDLDKVDILVNCAGAIGAVGAWSEVDQESLQDVAQLNVFTPVALAQACAPGMRRRGWGRIVNISSIYGRHGSPWTLPYSLSKSALDSATRAMALDLGSDGVTVNAIAPGNVDTAMTRRAGDEYIASVVARTPVGRLGQGEEIAEAVRFCVRCGFMTGQIITVDGGLTLLP